MIVRLISRQNIEAARAEAERLAEARRTLISNQNVELVRRAHELYRRGDLDVAIEECLDPRIEWETRWPGLPPVFHGHEGVREWVARAMEPMQIEMELIEARAVDDENVLAAYRARGRGRGSGVSTAMKIFDVLSIRNGMIYRRRTFYTEAEALAAVGPSE
jgi:ketosteroid isomerase-like protein